MRLRSLLLAGAAGAVIAAVGCTVTIDPGTVVIGSACSNDYDCVSGAFCDQGTGDCVAEGSIAVGAACNDDLDCLSGDFCDPVSLLCVTPDPNVPNFTIVIGAACIYDEECVQGAYCDHAGDCVADPNAEGSVGFKAACFDNLDCAQPYYCDLLTYTCE